jgi:hypothetical protein
VVALVRREVESGTTVAGVPARSAAPLVTEFTRPATISPESGMSGRSSGPISFQADVGRRTHRTARCASLRRRPRRACGLARDLAGGDIFLAEPRRRVGARGNAEVRALLPPASRGSRQEARYQHDRAKPGPVRRAEAASALTRRPLSPARVPIASSAMQARAQVVRGRGSQARRGRATRTQAIRRHRRPPPARAKAHSAARAEA